MLQARQADHLPHGTLTALLAVFVAVMLPHAARLPVWASALVFTVIAARAWIGWRGGRLPPGLALFAAAGVTAVGVALQYGTLFGRDAGVAMLALMAALKLLETRGRRDTVTVVYLMYFLLLTHFLYDQSLPTAGYMLIAAWATTALMVAVGRRGSARLGGRELRQGGALLLQALPVMAVLFVLFPRLPGPLWGMPKDAFGGLTGLSDTMTPGSISQLSRSDAIAFRVRFDGEAPPPSDRYWRALVMADYDGRQWSRAPVDADPPPVTGRGRALEYEVTLEPHNRRWLFALDLPAGAESAGRMTYFHELRRTERVREVMRYRARSHMRYRLQPELSEALRRAYTDLPPRAHPRTRALAARWRDNTGSGAALIQRALTHFRRQPFTYTLTPPHPGGDSVDGFVFETRRGFCEHFAGAFTVLMRAAGLPARVVTGYLGAEASADGSYWIVRQSDAHAWSEVWLPDEGWRRVDPTAAVSPDRVESGLGSAVPAGDPVPFMARADGGWVRELRLVWDLADATWTDWVLGYGPERQQRLLDRLGLDDTLAAIGGLAAALTAVMALLGGFALWRARPPRERDPVQREWRRAVRWLSRRGLPPAAGEGPRDYSERVAAAAPALAADVRAVARRYIRLRYYPARRGSDRQALRTAVKRLRRRRRS